MITRTPRRIDRVDAACVLLLLLTTMAVFAPSLFGGKVLLPADIIPLMPPWSASSRQRFPEGRIIAQNQMHGPIFEYYSWRHYARERIRAGEVPLWNPYELGGNVLLANSQSAVLYPPNLLLYLLPLWYGINLVTALHTFLTGLFTFGLLRALGLRAVSAFTGALIWMFCGLQIVWTEFQTPTAALCWLPAALWAWERYARTGDRRWALFGAGSAVALTVLAGHLHFAFYVILAFGLFAACRRPAHVVSSLRHCVTLASALGFGIALSSCTMLPVTEMARHNFRGAQRDYAASVSLRLPPENLLTLLQPNLFGNPRDYWETDASGNLLEGHAYWGKFDYIEYTSYLGIAGLALAFIGIWDCGIAILGRRRRNPKSEIRNPKSAIFVLLAAVGLLLALGTPLCAILFYAVPGYSQFNATARALCLFSFGMAALSAYGVDALIEVRSETDARRVRQASAVCIAIVVVAGLIAFPAAGLWIRRLFTDQWFDYELNGLRHFALFAGLSAAAIWLTLRRQTTQQPSDPTTQANAPMTRRPNARAIRWACWLLSVVAVADLLVWGARFNPQTNPAMLGYPTDTIARLQQAFPARVVSLETPGRGIKSFIVPNYNVVWRLREAQGADSLHTSRYHHMMERVVRAMKPEMATPFPDPNTIHFPSVDHPLFDLLNVKYIATKLPMDPARFNLVGQADLPVWENPRAYGPAWIAGRSERITGLDEAFSRMSDPGFDARQIAFVETDAGHLDTRAANGRVNVTHFAPHRIDLDIQSGGDGLLILSETAFPGWHAEVDGRRNPVVTADYLLRAARVPGGNHHMIFRYLPATYRVGLYVTCIALAAMIGSVALRTRRALPI